MSPMDSVSPATNAVLASCASSIVIAAMHLTLPASIAAWIALLRRRADEPPEHRRERRMRDRELPVHPAAGARARVRIGGLELAGAVFGREVAHDRVRFPQQEAVLFERRHQAVGVHGEIGGLLVLAEGAADVDALVRQLELADRPHNLLHVD